MFLFNMFVFLFVVNLGLITYFTFIKKTKWHWPWVVSVLLGAGLSATVFNVARPADVWQVFTEGVFIYPLLIVLLLAVTIWYDHFFKG